MIPKRTLRWTLLITGILILAGFMLLRMLPARGTRARIAAIRAEKLPTSPAESDVYYDQVPMDENAALAVWDAYKEFVPARTNADPESSRMPKYDLGTPLPPELAAAIESFLSSNKVTLQKLHAAVRLPRSRYPINLSAGAATLLPHLAHTKSMAQLLKWEAIYDASRGDTNGAFEAVQSGFGLAQTLRNEPILISELVRLACSAITLKSLERVISEHPLTPAQMDQLSRTFDVLEADGRRALERAFIGERAMGISFFTLPYNQFAQLGVPGAGPTGQGAAGAVFFSLYSASGLRQLDLSFYLEMIDNFASAASNQYPALVQRSLEADQKMTAAFSAGRGRLAILSRMLLPSISKAALKEASHAASLRCAKTALAVERFRRDRNGALPVLLADLVPVYLPDLPSDPINGAPLEYFPESSGVYRVVSPAATAERRSGNAKSTNEVSFAVLRVRLSPDSTSAERSETNRASANVR